MASTCTLNDSEHLMQRFKCLYDDADSARMASSRSGNLTAVEKFKAAGSVADVIGGEYVFFGRSSSDRLLSYSLIALDDLAAAALAACSSLRAARACGIIPKLVEALDVCYSVAKVDPEAMVKADRESRERHSSVQSHGSLSLQLGRIRLPTTPADFSRLRLSYIDAAVAVCDAALAAGTGEHQVPSLLAQAEVRARLGACLIDLGESGSEASRAFGRLWRCCGKMSGRWRPGRRLLKRTPR